MNIAVLEGLPGDGGPEGGLFGVELAAAGEEGVYFLAEGGDFGVGFGDLVRCWRDKGSRIGRGVDRDGGRRRRSRGSNCLAVFP